LVHTHSGKAGVIGRLAARRAGVPLIVHTIHGPSFGPFQGALANAVFLAAERRAGRVTDHFVVVAEAMARQYLAAGIGAPRQYSRIFSGFQIEPYLQAKPDPALRSRLGLAEGDVVAGMIARLFALKGHDDLLDVAAELAARCPRLKFLWVGDGAWRPRLEARMVAMGLRDRFVLAGLVPPEAVPRYVALMDLLVHLSRREGLPRALPQALAAGRPVVAYDCDGAGEVCRDNETGFLVAPGDRVALADRVLRLAENPGLRQRLGECGRAFVRQRFPVDRMVDELAVLYLQLAAGKAGRAGGGVPP
jgi:glycosyltransferase involved in cell wall biosynthesis